MKSYKEVIAEYSSLLSLYETFTLKIKNLVVDLMKAKKIKVNVIQSRTKDVESFSNKIKRKSRKYIDPLNEITDICGIRIIVNYQDEVDEIFNMIKEEFEVDEVNSIDKGSLLNPNEFGYRSVHYVASLASERKELTEWKAFSNFKVEIQIRTILQHSWALISHSLQYKRENDVPQELKRKLFRLASLVELADDEFMSLRNEHVQLEKSIGEKTTENIMLLDLNVITVKKYFEENELINKLYLIAELVGFNMLGEEDEDEYNEALSDLLRHCEATNIITISDLNDFIRKWLHNAEECLSIIKSSVKGTWEASVPFVLTLLIVAEFVDDPDIFKLVNEGWHANIGCKVIDSVQRYNDVKKASEVAVGTSEGTRVIGLSSKI
ncbi:hypothetical protein [Desulfosporosinus sp. OT]|uniref:GTP pyrophosphokinase n=1 Tax=Desulfosporosinus sp. OT TaxID=913865 RepID=UPI000223A5E6|nr:hypothetical protein [Desulfosporosinus sp. OT]EGW39179.1 region found in RelA / SpoT s family protein [Desulfosporosinus sp. OT]